MTGQTEMLEPGETFGFVRPSVDAHTLGISYVSKLLQGCGYRVIIGGRRITDAVNKISHPGHIGILQEWIAANRITRLGVSYRLDPEEAQNLFGKLFHQLSERGLMRGGSSAMRAVYFAGLPAACTAINLEYRGRIPTFRGDETPSETLQKLGVPPDRVPRTIREQSAYDEARMAFGRKLTADEDWRRIKAIDRSGYSGYGERNDHVIKRIYHGLKNGMPPLMRVHVGPYLPNRAQALAQFSKWLDELARVGLLDVVSIGTSQLTQSNFGEDWAGAPNGGGVPVNSEAEYNLLWEAARPMLVRTYAGTSRIPDLARMHERALNIAWHALSFWWFSQVDGRGPHGVYKNLCQHLETLNYIARTNKPFEPNIPHHFSFRGGDDVTYVLSAVLAARTAKRRGIRYFILQNMLNTPKYTSGIQDIAKARVMLKLVRELEDGTFQVIYQPRAGLDYFSTDMDKAKAQLAAVTALMDDVEPDKPQSPQIIHVVSYSEASHLADPTVINDSIRIVRRALETYRQQRLDGIDRLDGLQGDLQRRVVTLEQEVRDMLYGMERACPDLYTAPGLYKVFAAGYLPVPYLWERREEFAHAIQWRTDVIDGGVKVIDDKGNPVPVAKRAAMAESHLGQIQIPRDEGMNLQGSK